MIKNNLTVNKGAREILGVSHIVLGVRYFQEGESLLSRYGYSIAGKKESILNPAAKSPFLSKPTPSSCSMELMSGISGTPPVELLQESVYHNIAPHNKPIFEAVLGRVEERQAEGLWDELSENSSVVSFGFRELKPLSGPAGIVAFLVHCKEMDSAVLLWEMLGLEPHILNQHTAYIKIKSIMSSKQMFIYFLAGHFTSSWQFLNQPGIVCFSLLCKDSDRLRMLLKESGYCVGDCFTFAPFGRPLRIFFARNTSGEIYEFLSTRGAS